MKVDRIRLWTLKEAYVKATGDGITEALNRCTAALNPARIDALRPCQAWQARVGRNHIASVVLLDPTAPV
jgi:phosphopantetheinyl transferase